MKLLRRVCTASTLLFLSPAWAVAVSGSGSPSWSATLWRTAEVGVGLALISIAVLLVLVFRLRAQVARRTGELQGTERRLKLTEARAQAVVEALPDLLYFLDKDGVVTECREPVDSTYHKPSRFLGQGPNEAFPSEIAEVVRQKMTEVRASGGVGVVELNLVVDGQQRTYDGRIVRLEDGYLAIVRDMTSSRRLWLDDLHRNKLESLGVLAAGLAHDFNNSLGVIQGFVSLARLQLSHPEKAAASLDKAVQAAKRAAGLTGQLRVLAHGTELHRSTTSAKELAEEAASFALVGSPCVLAVSADEGPWLVEADADQLSQVFHNLMLNAVQAMPQGGTIDLHFRCEGSWVSVTVADRGEGIPADHLGKIFDPYFTTKTQGTGLGLSVAHAVVRRHGGTLEVESAPGRGTALTVRLPLSEKGLPVVAVETANPGNELHGLRVLVMEDEADLRDLIVQVSSDLGLKATACSNGKDAVAAFDAALSEGHPFALVVSDLLVPGAMGGREMITLLRSRAYPFRAVAVTGFSTERSVDDFQNQGFDVIMGKPFTVDELRTRLVETVKGPWKTAPSR